MVVFAFSCVLSQIQKAISQNMDWINQKGDAMLKRFFEKDLTKTRRDQLEAYIDEYITFKIEAKVCFWIQQ